jgi:phosphate-selective porin OprO and OprP
MKTRRPWLCLLLVGLGWSLGAIASAQNNTPVRPQAFLSASTPELELAYDTRTAEPETPLYTLEELRALIREVLAEKDSLGPKEALLEPSWDVPHSPDSSTEPRGIPSTSKLEMRGVWNNGPEWATEAQDYRVRLGGRVDFDSTWYQAGRSIEEGVGGVGPLRDAVNLRRARLRVEGTMYEHLDWAVEYEFVTQANDEPNEPVTNETAINTPAPTDVWLTFKQIPIVGNLRAGILKEPIGLERLTSSRFLDFMERSFLQDAYWGSFNNGFSPGAMLFNTAWDENATLAIGVFKNTSNIFGSGIGPGEYAVTGRWTMTPIYEEEGQRMIHLGIAASHRDVDDGVARIRSRPSLRSGNPGPFNPVIANTGSFHASNHQLVAAELAMVWGPAMFQSEYVASFHQDVENPRTGYEGHFFSQGWYVETLYFLTGDNRPYDRQMGVFGRVTPAEAFSMAGPRVDEVHGRGAWHMGARYALLDLRDDGIDGGVIQDVTLGLNWILNPNCKLQWNYVWTIRDAPDETGSGEFHGVGMRMAFHF